MLFKESPIQNFFSFILSFRINSVSNGQVRGDAYTTGCMGQTGMYRLTLIEVRFLSSHVCCDIEKLTLFYSACGYEVVFGLRTGR
jgi:hypothetical protein